MMCVKKLYEEKGQSEGNYSFGRREETGILYLANRETLLIIIYYQRSALSESTGGLTTILNTSSIPLT